MTATLVLLMLVAGCALLPAPSPPGIVRGGWVWPAAAPLPPGAIAVPLDVDQIPDQVRPDTDYTACPAALLGPVIPEYRAGAEPPVSYRGTGIQPQVVHVRWPVGFSARLAPGLEIVAPDGKIVARAGEPTSIPLGGGFLRGDDVFTVCLPEYGPTRVNGSP